MPAVQSDALGGRLPQGSKSPGLGMFKLLDEQCRIQGTDDMSFLRRWVEGQKGGPGEAILSEHRFGKDKFVVQHFAADVTYGAAGFLDKNKDTLHPDLIPAVQSSTDELIRRLFPRSSGRRRSYSTSGGHGGGGGGAKLFTATVGNQFSKQISALVKEVEQTGLYFVRCLNP
eukprot:SAG22_NODE_4538_length_1240_cov_1.369851_3_plen_171_part_01